MINKCQSDDSVLLDDTDYEKVFTEFLTDYDRENPVTKKAGTLRLIEERMKKESGGELTEDDKKALEVQKNAVTGASMFDAVKTYTDRRQAQNIQMMSYSRVSGTVIQSGYNPAFAMRNAQ